MFLRVPLRRRTLTLTCQPESWQDSSPIVSTEHRDNNVNDTPPYFFLENHSPVSCIPPELLVYIFELYVAHFGDLTPDGSTPQGLSCLAQVCKRWRNIAESNPCLWTSIHFYFPESQRHQSHEKAVGPLLDLYLKRSGTLPISLTFIDHRPYNITTKYLVLFLVDRLRAHARRWKRISLHVTPICIPILLTFTLGDLSSLERVCISSDTRVLPLHMHDYFFPFSLNLESATNLKSFAYSGLCGTPQDIVLHWENLSEVSFAFPHLGSGRTLRYNLWHLSRCQNITTCSLGIEENTRPQLSGIQTIILPCLETLRVRRLSRDAHACSAIDPLILPQLHTLEIDASNLVIWNQRWHDRNFSDLLARSGCSLLHLSIQNVDFPNNELVRCLALSPSLTSFRFIPCPRFQDINDILQALDVTSLLLVPRLREIKLGSSVEACLELMLAMFHSRARANTRAAGVASLKRADVTFFDLWHDRDVQQLCVPGDRLGRVVSFQAELARWVSESRDESGQEDMLEASMVVDSPYFPEYIDVQ